MPKVILVVIDGCRPDALETASTSAIDHLIASGASTMAARTVEPPITLPAHFSLFTSHHPRDHHVTTNTDRPCLSPKTCSIIEAVKKERLKTAAACSWELLRNLAPPGALDTSWTPPPPLPAYWTCRCTIHESGACPKKFFIERNMPLCPHSILNFPTPAP